MDWLASFDESIDPRFIPLSRLNSDPKTEVFLTREELKVVLKNAMLAEMGGKSHIRSTVERGSHLSEDQLTGQIGQAAGCKWWTGSLVEYIQVRNKANADPWKGDGGQDLVGLNLDFKCSVMRNPNMNPAHYQLLVRPAERHKDWVYVQLLMPPVPDLRELRHGLSVLVAGWARDSELPAIPATFGKLTGAFTLAVENLHPCGSEPDAELRQTVQHSE